MAERVHRLMEENQGRTLAEANISETSKNILCAIEIATRMLREEPDAEDYGFILSQLKRLWPSMDAEDRAYALGYALGRAAERDRLLATIPSHHMGERQ
jgi:hypothetical protein